MGPELTDLHEITEQKISPVLLEECAEWLATMDWDFSQTADLVRKYTRMRALDGAALLDRGEVAGYGYSVVDDGKAVIGNLYVRPPWRGADNELRLFHAMLDDILRAPSVRRIESQLMTVETASARAIQRERFLRLYERTLMFLADPVPAFPPLSRLNVRMDHWSPYHLDAAASVMSMAYQGHVDAQINDQYRTLAGSRKFIQNLLEYPGCGAFFAPASFLAVDRSSGAAVGLVMASFVSEGTGHISQLCIIPSAQRSGLGLELLQQSINVLVAYGSKKISLTVTVSNTAALLLYESCGFRRSHDFHAYVWEAD